MNINLVISGGGIKFFYLLGIKKALQNLNNKIIISKYSASSSGALFIVLMACNINNKILINNYLSILNSNKNKLELIDNFLTKVLPYNAYKICSNKVFISLTRLMIPFKNEIISTFYSNRHLIDIVKASCSFPLFINNKLYFKLNNKYYIDGCFTNNTPLFNNNNQIIIKPYLIKYDKINIFSLENEDDIKYINKGYTDFLSFLDNKKFNSIQWFDQNRTKKFYYIKILAILIIVIILIKK